MLQDFIIIVQTNIPTYTTAPTHYVRFATHSFLYFFRNNLFPKIFGPFSEAAGCYALRFGIPLLPQHILKIFPKFRPFFTSFFTTLNLLMIDSQYMYEQGCPNYGPLPVHGPYSFHLIPTPGGKRQITTSIVTPTPVLYSVFSFNPKPMSGPTSCITIHFSK